jgi:2-keto-4-pentenoate hydratase
MPDAIQQAAAAETLWSCWRERRKIDALPPSLRPTSRAEGYAVQSCAAQRSGQGAPIGWKIAATSAAGQKHINVSGPLAGRLFGARRHGDGARISLAGNGMCVVECEIAFGMKRTLARHDGGKGAAPYAREEVAAAVATVHPAFEIPDSRYADFVKAGEAQIVADQSCTNDFVIGPALRADERIFGLAAHTMQALRNGAERHEGRGSNVLGDPLTALTWLANELAGVGLALSEGDVVITGTCLTPIPVRAGDRIEADFGWLGRIGIELAA